MSGKDSKSIHEGEMLLVGAFTVAGLLAAIVMSMPWIGAGLEQWSLSYESDEQSVARYQEVTQIVRLWGLRIGLTLLGCPAIIALYALARGARTLAIVYGSIALGMAFPAAYLVLPAIATN